MDVGARHPSACGPPAPVSSLTPLKSLLSKDMGREPSPDHPAAVAEPPSASDGSVCSEMSPHCLEPSLVNMGRDAFTQMLAAGVQRVRLCLGLQAQSSSLIPGLPGRSSPASGSLLPTPLACIHPAWPSQSAQLPEPSSRSSAHHLLLPEAGLTERTSEPLLCSMITGEPLLTASRCCWRLSWWKPEFLGWLIFKQ